MALRLLPHPDSSRPHVRLGLLWFAAVIGGLALGLVAVGVVYGLAALVAGAQTARARRDRARRPSQPVAALAAFAVPVALGFFDWGAGAAVLVGVAVSVAIAPGSWPRVVAEAGDTITCWLFAGLAAASVVAALRIDLGAAIALVLLVSAYEAGDYLVGVDTRWPVVGTVAGTAAVLVMGSILAIVQIPPFGGPSVLVFAVALAVLSPIGQIVASILVPGDDALSSGLRRLDSLLVGGPVFVAMLWLYPFG